jgi:hypothetical protein
METFGMDGDFPYGSTNFLIFGETRLGRIGREIGGTLVSSERADGGLYEYGNMK